MLVVVLFTDVDYDATITVDVPNKGVRNIKPLQVIWEADGYKGIYTPKNTIHVRR